MLVAYARVSTHDQDHALQLDALSGAGCEKIFRETASGAQRDRPELKAALQYLRPGDTLVVWKLDRLARSLKQLVETIEELERRDVQFRSLTENIETTTPTGRLVFHLFAALSEFERSLIQERVRAGIEAARKKGKLGGRPRSMDDAKLKAAKALLVGGELSVAEVAQQIGVSVTTLYRVFPRARTDAGVWEAPKLRRMPTPLTNAATNA